MEWQVVALTVSMITLANGGFLWAVRWMLNNYRQEASEDLETIRAAIAKESDRRERLQKELSRLREKLPEDYVRREDWIMGFSRMEQKVDAIWEFLHSSYAKAPRNGGRDDREF